MPAATPSSRAAALLFAALAVGCGGYVGRAHRDYDEGLYLEAAERLGQHESEIERLSPRRRAEYGVYRGLSLIELGDLAAAQQWLAFAYEVERRTPGALTPEARAALDQGWARLVRVAPPSP